MAFAHPAGVIRTKVLWIRKPRTKDAEFTARELSLHSVERTRVVSELPTAGGLLISVDPKRLGRLADDLSLVATAALDHGVQIHVIAKNDAEQRHVAHVLKQQGLSKLIYAHTSPDLAVIAEQIARHNPGPAPTNLTFAGDSVSSQMELFLRRAFCDCNHLLIKKLTGGLTADVVSVHATFSASLSGPRPLPFFAKFATCDRFESEFQTYRDYVEHFVPFNLRPNLDYDRCFHGRTHGILVGNFVERSEPLVDVARRGHAHAAIYSLYDHALRGWRLQAKPKDANLHAEMPWTFLKDKLPPDLVREALRSGATHNPDQLEAIVKNCGSIKHLSGPVHGDLHSQNVQVRAGDAILIDFGSVYVGPILLDRACLEISLAFEEHLGEKDDGWRDLIDKLYHPDHFARPPQPAIEPLPREWLWTAVRQIRSIALGDQTSPKEYQQIAALCLLRFARLPKRESDTDVAEHRKMYAYVTADKLLSNL